MTVKAGDLVKIVPLYLEYVQDNSRKFWEIGWIDHRTWRVIYGRIGSIGTDHTKQWANSWEAQREYKRIVSSKLKKGYRVCMRPVGRPDCFPFSESVNLVIKIAENGRMAKIFTPEGKTSTITTESLQVVISRDN